MRPIIKSLCWKEFHELKSATVAAAAIVLAIPACYIFRDLGVAYLGVHTALWVYPVLAGVFFGMRAAAGERSNGTAPFIAALPVSRAALGTVRLVASLVAAAVPLSLLVVLGLVLAPLTEEIVNSQVMALGVVTGLSALGTAFCLTIIGCGGMGQSTEIRAAVVGGAVLVGTCIVLYGGLIFVAAVLYALNVVSLVGPEFGLSKPAILLAIVISSVTLLFGAAFVVHYSLALGSVSPIAKPWKMADWMPEAIPAHIAALVWKGGREIGVLGLYVLLVSLLLSIAMGTFGILENHPTRIPELAIQAMPAILLVGGFVLAILVGVGAAIGDLQPGVNTFWRSRPISPSAWYWTKYGIGLATILLTIVVPFILNPYAQSLSDQGGIFWWPLLWNVIFSFALTFTCLVRQPAHAAILAVGAAGILYALVQATFGSFTPGEPGAPMAIMAPAFLLAFAASTFLGSWAARHDVVVS